MNRQIQPYSSAALPIQARELTFDDVWKIFRRRRAVIARSVLMLFAIAVLVCVSCERRYRATGELQVEKGSMDGLGLSNLTGGTADPSDALDGNITIQTEATILTSDTLALKVIKDLNLESTADFKTHFHLTSWISGLVSPSGAQDSANASLEDSPGRRSHALLVFSQNLTVKPVAGTRLIQVTYTNPDPKLAAAIVNHLIQALTDFGFQTRYNATSQASDWLALQLSDLRKESENLQSKVVELQRDSGVFTLGGGNETDGKTQSASSVYSSVLDRLQQATASLSQAQSNRILKEAVYQAAKSGNAELISGLAGNAVAGPSSGLANSLSVIQNLRLQQATLQGQLDQLSAKFGPAYPKLEEFRANIATLNKETQAEVERIRERAKSDYEVSLTVENGARQVFTDQKRDADRLNDKAIEYTIVRQEAEQSRGLYETLLGRLKEAGLLEGLRSSNISIIDPARAPAKPATPNVPLYLASSLAAGLFIGSGIALVLEIRDKKIHDLRELEIHIGDTPLGILPAFMTKSPRLPIAPNGNVLARDRRLAQMIAVEEPQSPYVEALRGLRTALLLSRGGAPPQVILVTSSIASEGKTTLTLNLAILLAQQGKKVLLVDADLRRPTLHRVLRTTSGRGLSSLLTGHGSTESDSEFIQPEQAPGLHVLTAGPVPPYPSELLGSDQMRILLERWRKQFDFILFDGAPILPVTDSVILSELADSKLLLARFGVTERQSLLRSYALLQRTGPKDHRISLVINAVSQNDGAYHEYYGYSDSPYHQLAQRATA